MSERTENPVVARVRGREARGEMLTSIERFVLAQADEIERLTRELHDIRKHLPFDTLQNIELIERLTRERDWLQLELHKAHLANDRLRAALEEIVNVTDGRYGHHIEIARAALGSTPGENAKSE